MPIWSEMPRQFGPKLRAQYAAASEYSLSLHDDCSGSAGEIDDPDASYTDWFQVDDDDNPGMTRWVCVECGKSSFAWNVIAENWTCMECHGDQFYDATRPARHHTQHGTWVYMPHDSQSPVKTPSSQKTGRRKARRRWRHPADPPDDLIGDGQEETAESEVATNDPVIDVTPAGSVPVRGRPHRAEAIQPRVDDPIQALTAALQQLANAQTNRSSTSSDSWISAMGPQRGVKFRGGAPPQPPAWSYSASDIRAYEKYERKVKVWELQVKHYMTDAEAALTLFTSLRGEAEQELEFVDVNTIYRKGGVDTILSQLKQAFQQKTVYVKRQYLHEYESIGRYPGESLRAFINRYRRAEASLRAINIDISLTYDDESRGSRLLDRARLTTEQQRLILVGTGQALSFDAIRAALMLQFPEHKPTPPVAGRESNNAPYQPKGSGKNHQGSTSTSSSSTSSTGGGKGKGSGKGPRRVYQTETIQEGDENEEQAEEGDNEVPADDQPEEQGDPECEDAEAEVQEEDAANLAEVLTVTARKLANVTQGRKYSGQPKKSIQEKKRTSMCAACGIKGHWAGDPECEMTPNQQTDSKTTSSSFTSSQKGKDKGQKGREDSSSSAKKVMTVHHSSGYDTTVEYMPPHEQPHPHFAMVCTLPHVCLSTLTSKTFGFMIIDTACQRSCCGKSWASLQAEHLESFRLKIHHEASSERFQFGAGPPMVSLEKIWMPSSIQGCCLILGVDVIDANIPFLGSLRLLKRLGAVIDLNQHVVHFNKLHVTTSLSRVDGHLAIRIDEFPHSPNRLRIWSMIADAGFHDPEVATVLTLEQAADDTAVNSQAIRPLPEDRKSVV